MCRRLQVECKKRPERSSAVTMTALNELKNVTKCINHVSDSCGFRITDDLSGLSFLVDTGAHCSIFPARLSNATYHDPNVPALIAANGSRINTYSFKRIPLRFQGRTYKWQFVIADVNQPLLGADFLAHFKLLVDIARHRLVDNDFCTSFPLKAANKCDINACSPRINGPYRDLINDFPDVFRNELRQNPGISPKHGIVHYIRTNGPPVHSRFRRLCPEKLKIAKQYFADMERMGICAKSASPWASPLHMVPKSDGSFRPCGDYRRLNLLTEPDHYPTPNISDITSNLHGSKIFSKLDLLKGYFQVPVNPADVPKTAIITPFGTYVFFYSTFGLRNSGATFQRLMDTIFGNLDFCTVYVDDILVCSKSEAEHREHLRIIFKLLSDNGLVVRSDKCIFGASEVEFLGHLIDASGIRPLRNKVDAVRNFPAPTTVKQLQEFVGMINYYHRFIPAAAHILKPLYDVISNKEKVLQWTDLQQTAFENAKTALMNACTLSHPSPNASLILSTDASNVAVGAVLEQVVDTVNQPLSFFSKKLQKSETKYSTFDRELLAVYLAIRHFKYYLDGTRFTIRTDHQPLVHAIVKSNDAWCARQQRHLSAIAEMNCVVEYIPGNRNPVADALSRVEISSIQIGIDYSKMASAQTDDRDISELRHSSYNLKLENVSFGGVTILCDVSTGRPRPLVPEEFKRQVFDNIHGMSHPSIRSTVKLITSKFVWKNMNKDIRLWSRMCLDCQRSKVSRHTQSGIGQFPQPRRRFGHIHVDTVGPLPPSNGYRYLFTITDRSTRWPEAIPIEEANAVSCAAALLHVWVARFGVPDIITSDRGSVFLSELWTELAGLMGTRLNRTTAYNPEANGMVERLHRTLKQALMSRCKSHDWFYHLPWVMLGLRTTPKEGLDVSCAEMVYGEPLVVPGEFFPCDLNEQRNLNRLHRQLDQFKPFQQTKSNKRSQYIPKTLYDSPFVFIRNDGHRPPLTHPYRGPFKVIERKQKAFKIKMGNRTDWESVDRVKPAYLDSNMENNEYFMLSGRLSRLPIRLLL